MVHLFLNNKRDWCIGNHFPGEVRIRRWHEIVFHTLDDNGMCPHLRPILEAHENQRPIILVGHSLGGPLIARMAMDFPELVDGLVLVAPSIDPELEPYEWYRAPLATPFLRWLLPRSFRASNDEIYKLKPELEEMIPLWPKVRANTIVIQGMKDNLVPPANADFARKMITNAPVRLVIEKEMNHFIPWTYPQLIRNAVLELLKPKASE